VSDIVARIVSSRTTTKAKFRWTSIAELDEYLCGKCALKLSWEEVCHEGFEGTASTKEFTTRAKELGIEEPS